MGRRRRGKKSRGDKRGGCIVKKVLKVIFKITFCT